MTANGTERTLGKLLASVENLKEDVASVRETQGQHGKKIDAMRSKFDEQRGGLRVFIAISAAFGGVAGFAVAWIKSMLAAPPMP